MGIYLDCQVYKSSRQPDTYIYLPDGAVFDSLPEPLRHRFGNPEKVMDLTLDKRVQLAQADALLVMQKIREQGFFLQLPPNIYKNKHNPWS